MKKGTTYVDSAKLEVIWNSIDGIKVDAEGKGWIKLYVHGPLGQRVYVPRQKSVSTVELSAFETTGMGAIPSDRGGNVKQKLDFSLPENEILANFELTLRHMLTLAPIEKVKKAQPGKAPKPKAVGMTLLAPSSQGPKESKRERLERISKEMGVPLSAKTVAELEAEESAAPVEA